jgi:hypothetical protein
MTNPNSPLYSYFPAVETLPVDNEFSVADWDILLLVPMIDIEIVRKETDKLESLLSEKESKFNKLRFNTLYRSYKHIDFNSAHLFIDRIDTDKALRNSIQTFFSQNNINLSNNESVHFSSKYLSSICFPSRKLNPPSILSFSFSTIECDVFEQYCFPHTHKPFPTNHLKSSSQKEKRENFFPNELTCFLKFLDEHNKGNNIDLFNVTNLINKELISTWMDCSCPLFPISLLNIFINSHPSIVDPSFSKYSPSHPAFSPSAVLPVSSVQQQQSPINQLIKCEKPILETPSIVGTASFPTITNIQPNFIENNYSSPNENIEPFLENFNNDLSKSTLGNSTFFNYLDKVSKDFHLFLNQEFHSITTHLPLVDISNILENDVHKNNIINDDNISSLEKYFQASINTLNLASLSLQHSLNPCRINIASNDLKSQFSIYLNDNITHNSEVHSENFNLLEKNRVNKFEGVFDNLSSKLEGNFSEIKNNLSDLKNSVFHLHI